MSDQPSQPLTANLSQRYPATSPTQLLTRGQPHSNKSGVMYTMIILRVRNVIAWLIAQEQSMK